MEPTPEELEYFYLEPLDLWKREQDFGLTKRWLIYSNALHRSRGFDIDEKIEWLEQHKNGKVSYGMMKHDFDELVEISDTVAYIGGDISNVPIKNVAKHFPLITVETRKG